MKNDFVRKAISPELAQQIDDMIEKIKKSFNGYEINKIQASKIIAYKSKTYNIDLSAKKLMEILGGRIVFTTFGDKK